MCWYFRKGSVGRMCWDECDTTPCASPVACGTLDRTLLRLTVPQGHHRFFRCQRPVSMAPRSGSPLLTVDDAHWTQPRFPKVTTGSGSSGDEFGVLEDDQCTDTDVFQQRYLVHELVFACSPFPAAALPDQPYSPDSRRVVYRSRSGPVRTGVSSQSSRPRRRELAVLRCTFGLARRPPFGVTVSAGLHPWRLKGQHKCVQRTVFCLPPLSPQQPFHSNPKLVCIVSPGAKHDKTTNRSYRDFCYRRLSSRTARSRVSFAISHASVQIRLCLRGVAGTEECAILPIRELAAYPRCSTCELPSSGEPRPARRSVLAPVLIDEVSWRALGRELGEGRQPLLRATRQYL